MGKIEKISKGLILLKGISTHGSGFRYIECESQEDLIHYIFHKHKGSPITATQVCADFSTPKIAVFTHNVYSDLITNKVQLKPITALNIRELPDSIYRINKLASMGGEFIACSFDDLLDYVAKYYYCTPISVNKLELDTTTNRLKHPKVAIYTQAKYKAYVKQYHGKG